jgi:hypothetical protein
MDETFEDWRKLVNEQLKATRQEVAPEGVSPEALHRAFREGLTPAEFCALPAAELTHPAEPIPAGGTLEFRNSKKLCIGNAVLFYLLAAAMAVAMFLLREGAFGKVLFGEWVVLITLGLLAAAIGTAYLLMLRPRWMLHADRLEYKGVFGRGAVIRKDDVVSFARTSGFQSYVLKDGRSSIYVGRPIADWQPIHDVLNEWAANEPGV